MASTEILLFLMGLFPLHLCVPDPDEVKDYQTAALKEHNRRRAFHNISALKMYKDHDFYQTEYFANRNLESGQINNVGDSWNSDNTFHFFTNGYIAPMGNRDVYDHVMDACYEWYAKCRFLKETLLDLSTQNKEKIRGFVVMINPLFYRFNIVVAHNDQTIVVMALYAAGCPGTYIKGPKDETCDSAQHHLVYSTPTMFILAILTTSLTNCT